MNTLELRITTKKEAKMQTKAQILKSFHKAETRAKHPEFKMLWRMKQRQLELLSEYRVIN